ncbi:MAG TPA: hypothetical protein VKE98_09905 [Gemmataceae bacterium]|nr:hypothetical protein [Gemmataceae bacterium]
MTTISKLLALKAAFADMVQKRIHSTICFAVRDNEPCEIGVDGYTADIFQRNAIKAGDLLFEIPELVKQISPNAMSAPDAAQRWFRLLLDFRPGMIFWAGEGYPAGRVHPTKTGARKEGRLYHGHEISVALLERLALLWEKNASKRSRTKRRPLGRRGNRVVNIAKLTEEMMEHVRAARDHAFATRELGGQPQLLPRPKQKDLASRTGLTPSAVSRCLKDAAARELQILWERALDLRRIMDWKGSCKTAG